jgi:hypothetical protein
MGRPPVRRNWPNRLAAIDFADPSFAKRRKIASIRFGGNFAPPKPADQHRHVSPNDMLDDEALPP